ncbi:hypothetical protein ABZ897_11880 [Nonomuraea sp. NPDC046802]
MPRQKIGPGGAGREIRYREDASKVRTGTAPRIMAIGLTRLIG